MSTDTPPWTIEGFTSRPSGVSEVLVRLAGGRHVKVSVPAARANDVGMLDAIEVAIAHLPPPPGPNT